MVSFEWSAPEIRELNLLLNRAETNLRAMECFSRYLNLCPTFLKKEDVEGLCRECGLGEEEAFRLLMAASCGLNGEASPEDAELENRYFPQAVHLLDGAECRSDLYYRTVHLPEKTLGRWKMGQKRIEAYEAFTSDDVLRLGDGREIPQIGFFKEAFTAPVVYEDGREWMTVTPSEINTMTRHIQQAHGKTAVFGLGLGYYAFMASMKPEVSSVTVIERNEEVIALFRKHLLPQFPCKEKIRILQWDAFEYARQMSGEHYDCAYVDLWHDVLDGAPMYLRMKKLEEFSPNTRFMYWIEPSILCWIRGLALQEVRDGSDCLILDALGNVGSYRDLQVLLSPEVLCKNASRIPLEAIQR